MLTARCSASVRSSWPFASSSNQNSLTNERRVSREARLFWFETISLTIWKIDPLIHRFIESMTKWINESIKCELSIPHR